MDMEIIPGVTQHPPAGRAMLGSFTVLFPPTDETFCWAPNLCWTCNTRLMRAVLQASSIDPVAHP